MIISTKFYKPILKAWIILIITGISFQSGKAAKIDTSSHSTHQSTHNQHAINVGKRLFHGLISTGEQTVNCASCHYTNQIDTLNWNPSAHAIAKSTEHLDSAAFANELFNQVSQAGMTAHENIELSSEQVSQIRAYLGQVRQTGLKEEKPVVTKLLIFIGLIVLIIILLADLAIFKKIKKSAIHFLLITGAIVGIVNILYKEAVAIDRMPGYQPLQPIKFSHKIHATDNKIDCMYCHHTAEKSKSAHIPGPGLCINCHEVVMEGSNSGDFEINKIKQALNDSVPLEWVRIHQLPDHVFFSHAQHTGVAGLDCQACHGPVEEMHVVKQYSDLSMGWCLDCHRTRKVNMLENSYYQYTFEEFHQKLKEGKIDSVLVKEIGGTDCMKCHY